MNPLEPYLIWIKLGLVAVAAVILVALGFQVNHWRKDSARLGAAEARTQEIAKQAADAMALLAEQQRVAQKSSEEYQDDLVEIRTERDRLRDQPARVVRLCLEPDGVRATAATAGRPDAPGAEAAQPAATAGPDVGSGLYAIVDDGDQRERELAAQLSRLQEWIRETR